MLDHVIALDERHLRRLVREYVAYHHEDRIHDALAKDTPNRRCVECRPSGEAEVASSARLGGLHHRYSSENRDFKTLAVDFCDGEQTTDHGADLWVDD